MPHSDIWRDAYLGSARVPISNLVPRQPRANHSPDEARLKALVRDFALAKCRNLDEDTRIVALITTEKWHSVRAGATRTEPYPLLHLPLNEKVVYQQGLHRLAAACCVLPQREQVWGVDFYDAESMWNAESLNLLLSDFNRSAAGSRSPFKRRMGTQPASSRRYYISPNPALH